MALSFGAFRLDRPERRLLGPEGPVELSARSFDILAACLDRPGELLSKSDLLDAAWPGVAVEENTLQVHMSALRKVLGPGYIATVHGRGYRYVGPAPREETVDRPLPTGSGGNLKRYQVDCVAREAESGAVAELLSKHRLVSILGPGGVGKTTLALAVGANVAESFPHGVWVIDLAAIADGGLVESAIVQTMGIPFRSRSAQIDSILEVVRSQRLLLILDNCEHVAEATARLAQTLLAEAQHLRILTTTQVPLRVPSEHVYRLAPFALSVGDESDVAETPAARFLAHCFETLGETIQPGEIPVVVRLCRRLDGVALALKMAAARAATLGIEAVDHQIEEHLAVLVASWDTPLPRHRSLSASLNWSHDLLSDADRRALRALGVFQGSFTLEGFRAVTAEASDDSLAELVRRSLIVRDVGDRSRYRLLETTRHFALEHLKEAGEEAAARTRHARFMEGLLAASIETWETMSDDAWLAVYQPDLDNLRAALDWSRREGDWRLHLSIAACSYRLWIHTRLPTEGMQVCEAALTYQQGVEPIVTARLRLALAQLARVHREDVKLREVLDPALAIFASAGDNVRMAEALTLKGITQLFGPNHESARETLAELDLLIADMPANKLKARALVAIGMSNWFAGDRALARARFGAGLALQAASGNDRGHFKSVMEIAEVLHQTGDNDGAIALVERTMPDLRARATPSELGQQVSNLATYWLSVGNIAAARPLLIEAAEALAREDGRHAYWCVILSAGEQAILERDLETGALLLGFVDGRFATIADGYQMTEQMQRARMLATLERGLAASDLQRLTAQGSALSLFEASVLAGFAKDREGSALQQA